MFGHRYFGAAYFGPEYFGPSAGAVVTPTTPSGGWDTSDPIYYDWWRRQARAKDEPEPPPELVTEVMQLISAPITRATPISAELIRTLAGQIEVSPFDAAPITAALRALAVAELKRIAAEERDEEDEAIMLLMLQ